MEVRKVIQAATQYTINAICIVVFFIISVLGFDLCKTIISVLLTELFLYYNFTEEELNRLQESARTIIALTVFVIAGFYIHRRKGKRQSKERLKILRREAASAKASERKELKLKLLTQIRKATIQKSPFSMQILAIDMMQIRNHSPLGSKICKSDLVTIFEKQQNTEKASGKEACPKKTKKRRLGGPRRRYK